MIALSKCLVSIVVSFSGSFSVSNADNHIVNNAMYDNTAMNHRWQDNKRGGSALSHRKFYVSLFVQT